MSQAITPFHFFYYFNFNFYRQQILSLDNIHRDMPGKHACVIFSQTVQRLYNCATACSDLFNFFNCHQMALSRANLNIAKHFTLVHKSLYYIVLAGQTHVLLWEFSSAFRT